MRPSKRPEPTSAPSSKTSIIEADCTPRSATNPQPSSKPNSAKPKPSERTQPKLCPSNPVPQPRGAVHFHFLLFPGIGTYQGVTRNESRKKLRASFPCRVVPLEAVTAKLTAGSKGPDMERSPRKGLEQR